ncbi:MAG: hypothetical protein EBU84_01410, partial [Actinobacteria bacterium]|nr:hypothetical protein [Actinomycetota bacterium]
NGTKWFAAGQASSGAGILASSTDGLLWADVTYTGFSTFSYTIASRRVLPFVGTGGSIPGLYYRASGPTGPTGGQTGPTGPWLQVSANMVPVTDNVFDLGATGLRFRDIHVGGSTIYLGDSVSIKATNEGALTVSNNAGTVNLVTPTGLNGGILSGVGNSWSGESSPFSEVVTFSTPFAEVPVVVVNCTNSYGGTAFDTYKVAINSVTESNFVVYGNNTNATYNWIATARTDYPFEFYNETTPITEVSVTDSSLVLSVNTNLLLRGGVPPYTDVEMQAYTGGGNPGFTAVPINMNTGVQTITIEELIANSTYSIYISATDSSATPVTITSDPQDFTTDYAPLNIGNSIIETGSGDADAIPPGTYTATKITVYTNTQGATGGSGTYTYKIAYSPSNDSPTFDVNNMVEAPWIDIGSSEEGANLVAFGLIANSTYYFIMYVSDSTATELAPVFTTPLSQNTTQAAAPTVTGTAAFNSGNGTIELTGSVANIGTSPIEASGMCYSTTDPPTIDDTFAVNQGELPNIIAYDNPSPGATYYVRAYATNFDSLTGYSSTSTVVVPAS